MKDEIIRKILNGEEVRFSVDGPEKPRTDMLVQLRQFSGQCGNRHVLTCNSYIIKGVESLRVKVGVLSNGQRQSLASAIGSAHDLEIKEITQGVV